MPLLFAGTWWLGREATTFRALVWAWLVALGLTFVTAGRPYYPLPLTLVIVLGGVVFTAHRSERFRRGTVALVALNALVAVPLGLPVLPSDTLARLPIAEVNESLVETVGWPELVDVVEETLASLPPAERVNAIILTRTYGEAGALDRLGGELPEVYSGHNAYGFWRQPPPDTQTVVTVRYTATEAERSFEACERVATIENEHGLENEVAGAPVLVCRGLRKPWTELWPAIRYLG